MHNLILILALWVQSVLALIPEKDLKPNIFVLTDISNEPDDAESLVRLLLYTNELNLEGIVATTSYWLNYTVHDEDIYPIIDAYEKVYPNLLKHSEHYPTAEYLRSIISTGKPVYGLKALEDKISRGAESLISAIDGTPVEDGLYVLVWGGASVIAEALNHVKTTRSKKQVTEFITKLTIYSISDQDNAGPWIRFNFPKLKYIASIHGFNQYGHAAWVGISGEIYNAFDDGGPDSSLVSKKMD
jgi:hypothetical protein